MVFITATKLYDYIQCPHRVWRDLYGPQDEKSRDQNPFLQLLWERGIQHEKDVIRKLGDFVDLSQGSIDERFKKTLDEIKKGSPLIYQGVLKHENLLGIPDLLKKGTSGQYIPIDIKSGQAFEGADDEEGEDGKPKKHYAIQLCLYVDILKNLGLSDGDKALIIDISGREFEYPLSELYGKREPSSWWDLYEQFKLEVGSLLGNQKENKPALCGVCKLCPWYESCLKWCRKNKDLTNIFYLGRGKRDVLESDLEIRTIPQFLDMDIQELLARKKKDKSFLSGVGEATLKKLYHRTRVFAVLKKPVLLEPVRFPKVSTELFFDIEDDPTQGFVYLHGVWERKGKTERFVYFLAHENTEEEEKKAWKDFWSYIRSLPKDDYAVYYYSHHEKTVYRSLWRQYPDVVAKEELEGFFESPNVIDLYQVVFKNTDWPLSSYSLKEIASYLGFQWRDETPSGALSIQWFNEYLKTRDSSILKRILEYNEDDCKATMVIKDFVEKL